MTVRGTVRAATDRGPQAENRVLFGAPNSSNPNLMPIGEGFGFVLFLNGL